MSRLHTWQTRFAVLCMERKVVPFEWGKNDCCLWAADAVLAITGKDFAEGLRGTYATTAEAARMLARVGGVRQLATDVLGDPVSPLHAAVGDVVLFEDAGRELLAVCNGGTALAVAESGLEPLPMSAALAAWRV
ncbi:hypothetical protein [Hydrogenophaga sp.]|uniref:DUF6950 family protein n=1 Tax=Hydrogenophaga sp. TaxID=1904254 RepID=UPI0025BB954A|nr:hypothetical protein [Hydrogenophaga sp.]